jgi:hypothetical protein
VTPRNSAHPGPPRPPDADDLILLGGGGIAVPNARPMLEMLALYAGSGLDQDEWAAAERQLADTDHASPDGWYSHAIEGGVARLVVMMARNQDGGDLSLRIWGEEGAGLSERIDTLLDICGMYYLTPADD